MAVAPSFSTWHDLGRWWALNSQVGVEHTLESNVTEFLFRASLIHTFGAHDAPESESHGHEHDHHGHLAPGHLSLILEADGTVGLSDHDSGVVTAEGIAGIHYGLARGFDVRIGYQFPLSSPRDLDSGFIVGLAHHF